MIVLDRFEGEFAVIEQDGVTKNIPKAFIDKNVTEGSVIIKKGKKYYLDEENTAARREKIVGLQESLFED